MPHRPRLILSAFTEFTVSQHDHGLWSRPDSEQTRFNELTYWVHLTKLLERGRFDMLFFADILGPYSRFRGDWRAAVETGTQFPINDSAVLIPALAALTDRIGFVHTQNVLQEHPYVFARKLSTIDHITAGRIGWNIVTSEVSATGSILGFGGLPSHKLRYDIAREYVDVVLELWERSWADDAVIADGSQQIYADPDRVRPVRYEGSHFRLDAPHSSSPSPQRSPFLVQAAASETGLTFAARHAELIISKVTAGSVGRIDAAIRKGAESAGRRREDVALLTAFPFVVGSTETEARALDRELIEQQSLESILVKFSEFWQFDLSLIDLHSSVGNVLERLDREEALIAALTTAEDRDVTFEDFVRATANRRAVGTPEQLVREILHWQELGAQGLNVYSAVFPASLEQFVDHVVPLLQAEGVVQREYGEGTLRRQLTGRDRLPENHPARAGSE